jgi:methyl-accepting chemotaxis protein
MKLTLGKKLGLGYGVILVLMATSTVLGYLKLRESQEVESRIFTVRVPSVTAGLALQRDLNQTGSKIRQAIIAGTDRAQFEEAQQLFNDFSARSQKDISVLDGLSASWTLQSNRDHLAVIERETPLFFDDGRIAMKLATEGGVQGILKGGKYLNDTAVARNKAIQQHLSEMVESQQRLMQEDVDKLASNGRSTTWTLLVASLVALVIGIVVATLLGHNISRATQSILVATEAIAAGDLTREELPVLSSDELGDMTKAINKMSGSLKGTIRAVSETAEQLATASEELSATSQQITANSEETSTQANVVAAAGEQVSTNVSVVATGSEEMLASIREIAKSSSEAARVAKNAMVVAETTNRTIAKLGDSSIEIGEVIKVITSIAQQTNLLALNATIEAARAGEAGKGFAVVANEVKELAKETSKATEDISRKIEAIQGDTKGAVQAIGEISAVINQINDISGTIASAVEEQTATTNEMGRNIAEAAKGSSEIARNVAGVAEAARSTSTGASETNTAAGELARMAAQMQKLLQEFKVARQEGHAKAPNGRGASSDSKTMAAHA